jgi:hypothetical protein
VRKNGGQRLFTTAGKSIKSPHVYIVCDLDFAEENFSLHCFLEYTTAQYSRQNFLWFFIIIIITFLIAQKDVSRKYIKE